MPYVFYNEENEYTKILNDSSLDNSFLCIVGGDGTYLRALSTFNYGEIPRVLAFFNGTVGFLLPLKLSNIPEILTKIKENRMRTVRRSRISIKSHDKLISNEIVIRSINFQMNSFKIHISENVINESKSINNNKGKINESKSNSSNDKVNTALRINACEVIISTKTGSTGYNSSLNGPIIFSEGFVLNCAAPNRCNFRPLVFPKNTKITVFSQGCIGYMDGVGYEGDVYEMVMGDSYEMLVEEDYDEYGAINSIFYNKPPSKNKK